jgi:hypothetical protein
MARRRGFGTGRNGATPPAVAPHRDVTEPVCIVEPTDALGEAWCRRRAGSGSGSELTTPFGGSDRRPSAIAVGEGSPEQQPEPRNPERKGSHPVKAGPCPQKFRRSLWQSVSSPSRACGSLARAVLLLAPGCVGVVRLGWACSPFSTRGASPRYWRDLWIAYVGTPRGRCGERARPPARSHGQLSGGGRRLPVAIGDGEGDRVVAWCRELVCRVGHG